MYVVRTIAAKQPVSPSSNVVVNCCTPGACKSDIFRDDLGWFQRMMMNFAVATIARTTEVGSRTLIQAVEPNVGAQAHGQFLMDCKVRK